MSGYHHLFGPVWSRRLHRSLGVDLLSFKTCSYNCVYCECGATTSLTSNRREFFPVQDLLDELDRFMDTSPALDYITLAGSGEPTLSRSLGTVIRYIKDTYPPYRVAVLTNASLLGDPAVRSDLMEADLILPTFSTVVEETFQRIHRPDSGIFASSVLEGIVQLRKEFTGVIWLEVFIIPGLNTSDLELAGIREGIRQIHPDRVQLNTLDRPGTERWVAPASLVEISRIRSLLGVEEVECLDSEYF